MTADADSPMPYTHWTYFTAKAAAEACGAELDAQGFLVALDSVDSDSQIPQLPEGEQWLLRAAKPVLVGKGKLVARHAHVESIVQRHGGFYDGGESGWLDPATGKYLEQGE